MLAVVIPTCNRPDMLRRLVAYYRGRRLIYPIHVADSSSPDIAGRNQACVAEVGAELDIHYHGFSPTISFVEKVIRVLTQLDTPLVGLCADDDFITPEGLGECGEFLINNPEYAAAHGYAISFTLQESAGPGDLSARLATRPYRQRSLEQNDPLVRMTAHLTHYSTTFYSLQRREGLIHDLSLGFGPGMDVRLGEIFMSCAMAIRGKIKRLDVLYMAREVHQGSINLNIPRLEALRRSGEFFPLYQRFRQLLIGEFEASGVGPRRAARAIDFAFRGYSARVGRPRVRGLGHAPNKLLLLIYYLWDLKTPGARIDVPDKHILKDFSVPALLAPASPHQSVFRPIYDAILSYRSKTLDSKSPISVESISGASSK